MDDNYVLNINGNSEKPVIIFFTSNAQPDKKYDFSNITKTDYFQKRQYDSIFIRDVRRAWYAYGINDEYNDINEVFLFLKEKCEGRRIITAGSSAGGYAAIMFGTMLKAERIVTFGPQIDLDLWMSFYKNSSIYDYLPSDFMDRLPETKEIINNSSSDVYCFFPSLSRIDVCQYETVNGIKGFRCFLIKSNEHGRTIFGENMLDVIFSDTDKLDRIYKKMPAKGYSATGFLFSSAGFLRAIGILSRKAKRTASAIIKK